MSKFEVKHGSMEMWLVCEAIGKQHDLISKMKKNTDGSYPVEFRVGGVELDFNNVAQRLENSINELILTKAKELVITKYDELMDEIEDIKERITQQQDLFKYDWE